jgi:hypothetical protein
MIKTIIHHNILNIILKHDTKKFICAQKVSQHNLVIEYFQDIDHPLQKDILACEKEKNPE